MFTSLLPPRYEGLMRGALLRLILFTARTN